MSSNQSRGACASTSYLVTKDPRTPSRRFFSDYRSLISGKHVLVTGASRGIGRHLALFYARHGANLVITARDETALQGVVEECRRATGTADTAGDALASASASTPSSASSSSSSSTTTIIEYVVGAQGTPEEAQSLIDRASGLLGGRLDILFLNHGLSAQSIWRGTPDQFHAAKSAMEVNYFSQIYLTSAALPLLKQAEGGGSVVIVNSASARSPMPSFSYYGASKAAMATFFRSLRLELQQSDVNVSITVCTLGLVKTERNIGKETSSLAFRLGAEPDEAAEFMIQSAANRKTEVKYPKIQFLVKDLIDALPSKLRKTIMQKVVPKSKD